jgi:acyl dehydratase
MAYDPTKAIGHTVPDKATKWNRRDVLLYAVGIGAKATDLNMVYELNPNFSVFPTFPAVLNFRGESQDVIDFNGSFKASPIPGLPPLEPSRLLHATMSIEILRELPPDSGEGWKLTNRITGIHENKSGIIVENEIMLVDPHGTPYTRMISGSFNIGAKALGKPFSKAIIRAPQAKAPPKDKAPDHVVKDATTPEQAAIYRLSGDYNPLHIDPSIGQRAGFGGTILHGLATYGTAARAIIAKVGGGDPRSLKAIAGRFTSPLKPGDVLEISIWEMGSGPNGTAEVAFVCKNLTSGKVAISNGVAHIVSKASSKL